MYDDKIMYSKVNENTAKLEDELEEDRRSRWEDRLKSESEVIIDDNGPGIPRDKRVEVVLPFTRLENSRNSKTGGTGLGLSIAKNSALNHGGELILEDSPLGGLRVRLLLPLWFLF